MSTLWSDPRITWVATVSGIAVVLALLGFFGRCRELREDSEAEPERPEPRMFIPGRPEIKIQAQPKSFTGIPDRLTKRTG